MLSLTELLSVLGRVQPEFFAEQKAHMPHAAKACVEGHGLERQGGGFQQVPGPVDARALQERLGVTRLPLAPEDQALLLNCNTPSEWESITA